ncbi:MAG: hypothetical protein LBJ22_06895, partial [Synergistaceae bacterium]|nr:hypothetical protein [Synergistaceae bacterium]
MVFLGAAAIVFCLLTSAAWADASSVAAVINRQEGLEAVADGDTVTVTGMAANVLTSLDLDVSGVNVIWNATLTGDFKEADSEDALLLVSGAGGFVISPGAVVSNDAAFNVAAVKVTGSAELTVKGTVYAEGDYALAIYSEHGTITVEEGAKVQAPRGFAIATYEDDGDQVGNSVINLKDKTGIAGIVTDMENGKYTAAFYGDMIID